MKTTQKALNVLGIIWGELANDNCIISKEQVRDGAGLASAVSSIVLGVSRRAGMLRLSGEGSTSSTSKIAKVTSEITKGTVEEDNHEDNDESAGTKVTNDHRDETQDAAAAPPS
ncbi:hypothetical protein QVD17_09200 [Tagetes erecta]|uniref:Uncharacterized protein n=1 Tax=Tagetes erecta TaxID=13708 RepID=A0AAD8KYX2_TARER|nr:hypothetical protein QVD17_09200 [Tagetes erecta]